MRHLRIEGWRGIAHSYAIVNQYHCLELLRRPGLRLSHRDWPLRPGWRPTGPGLFSPEEERDIAAIPAPDPDQGRPDTLLRLRVPYDLTTGEAVRTLVFGTAEFRCVPHRHMEGGEPLATAMARSDAVIVTPSFWSRTGFLAAGAPPSRVVVVPHGVDTRIFRPPTPERRAAGRARLGLDGVVFLSVGALTANKGMPKLLKAFAVVAGRYPHVRLLIKGNDALYRSGDVLNGLMAGAAMLTARETAMVAQRLTYLGETLGAADMAAVYGAADVYVTPYRAEGFNMPAMEAAACGLPVICTRGGPTDDFVTDAFALRIQSTPAPAPIDLVPEGGGTQLVPDLDHLIDLMVGIVEAPEIVARARTAGPAHMEAHYTWTRVVDHLMVAAFP